VIRRLWPVLAAWGVILTVVSPLFAGRRYAFRDISHFYLPLYDYVDHRSGEQWLPLWNPLDHTGMPLIGEASTAVLYPVRWIVYALPIDNVAAMNVYLVVHLLIASAAAGVLARRCGARPVG